MWPVGKGEALALDQDFSLPPLTRPVISLILCSFDVKHTTRDIALLPTLTTASLSIQYTYLHYSREHVSLLLHHGHCQQVSRPSKHLPLPHLLKTMLV